MRVLNLGNSTDERFHGTVPGSPLDQICAELKRRTGEDVEGVLVRALPNAGLARFTQKVLDREHPDIVILHCSGYLVEEETLAYGLTRRFGPKAVNRMMRARRVTRAVLHVDPDRPGTRGPGLRLRAYTAIRKRLLVHGLGGTLATVETVAASYEEVIRVVAAREDIIFIVRGPTGSVTMLDNPAVHERAQRRLVALDDHIRAACAARRVPFVSTCDRFIHDPDRYFDTDDRLHTNAAGLAVIAQEELKVLLPLLGY
jgi:hypothetical protein